MTRLPLRLLLACLTVFTIWTAVGDAYDYEILQGGGSGGSSESSVDPASPRGLPGSERASVLTGRARLGTPSSAPSIQASGRGPVTALAGGTLRPATLSSRASSIRAVRRVFGSRAPAALRVVACETGGTFYARSVGSQGERGIFQIHPVHFGWAQPWRLFDPVWNSRVAYRLSRGGTRWGAWSCGWAA